MPLGWAVSMYSLLASSGCGLLSHRETRGREVG